ncbi:MAG TPA: hypothetical protein VFN26_14160 [Candidatus Acidoferrum sp.]|jgi:hypothetical protein|nr:hypothetical protein [Candidatus Acidoferrum sp.]
MPIAVRSLEASTYRYLRNCIRAYFEGNGTLRWVIGVIGGATSQAHEIVAECFAQYANTHAYRELLTELRAKS